MKATVIGVKRVAGKSKNSGNQFDMPRALLLSPIRPMVKAELVIEGYGYEINEIAIDWDLAQRFSQCRFPAQLDLETDVQPVMGKFEPVVVDFKELPATAIKAA